MKLTTDEAGTVHLEGNVDIHHARELHEALAALLQARREDFVIDLAKVTQLDTAGTQVLMAFKRSVPRVRVQACPPEVRSWLERTGLTQILS